MAQLYEIVVFTDSMGGLADEVREKGRGAACLGTIQGLLGCAALFLWFQNVPPGKKARTLLLLLRRRLFFCLQMLSWFVMWLFMRTAVKGV